MFKETSVMIDLVVMEYNTSNPRFIQRKVEEIFEYCLALSEIHDYFNWTEDYEKESYTIEMGEIFNEYE